MSFPSSKCRGCRTSGNGGCTGKGEGRRRGLRGRRLRLARCERSREIRRQGGKFSWECASTGTVTLQERVGLEKTTEGLGLFVGEVDEGKANFIGAMALEGDGRFDGDWVGVQAHEPGEEGIVTLLKFEGFGVFSFEAAIYEADHDLGNEVGGDADEANRSAGHEGESKGVVAGEDLEVLGNNLHKLVDAIDGATSFFVGDDVFAVGGEAGNGFDADLDDGASGNRVEHDGKAGVGCDCFVVLIEAFLRRLVVVWADLEGGIGSRFFGGLREVDRFDGGVCSTAGHDEGALVGIFDGSFDHFEVFVGIQSGGFTRGPNRNDSSDSCRDLPINEGLECLVVK